MGSRLSGTRRRRAAEPEAQHTAGTPRWPELLQSCAARLHELGVSAPDPFDLDEFVDHLCDLRGGRKIQLWPFWLPPGGETVCGRSIVLHGYDVVYYAHGLSQLATMHNAVHELAHLILGHNSVVGLTRSGPEAALAPDAELERALADSGIALDDDPDQAEREAEATAAVLLGRWDEPAPRPWAARSALRLGAGRLADALR